MSLVRSRSRRRSLSRGILPTNLAIEYFKCPRCGLIGVIVTQKTWINCDIYGCKAYFHLNEVGVTREDYEKLWGLST